jgi:hypothetical protein
MMFSVYYGLRPPSPARAVPTPHLVFHTPPFRPITTHQLHNGPHHQRVVFKFLLCAKYTFLLQEVLLLYDHVFIFLPRCFYFIYC